MEGIKFVKSDISVVFSTANGYKYQTVDGYNFDYDDKVFTVYKHIKNVWSVNDIMGYSIAFGSTRVEAVKNFEKKYETIKSIMENNKYKERLEEFMKRKGNEIDTIRNSKTNAEDSKKGKIKNPTSSGN